MLILVARVNEDIEQPYFSLRRNKCEEWARS